MAKIRKETEAWQKAYDLYTRGYQLIAEGNRVIFDAFGSEMAYVVDREEMEGHLVTQMSMPQWRRWMQETLRRFG